MSNATRRGSDASLLSLNTLLQAIPGVQLKVEMRDDTTVAGMLEESDVYMK